MPTETLNDDDIRTLIAQYAKDRYGLTLQTDEVSIETKGDSSIEASFDKPLYDADSDAEEPVKKQRKPRKTGGGRKASPGSDNLSAVKDKIGAPANGEAKE